MVLKRSNVCLVLEDQERLWYKSRHPTSRILSLWKELY